MHSNIIQLLFLDSIKNRIEHLETYRMDHKLVIDIRLKKEQLQCLICQDQMKFHSYRLKQIHYGITSFEAYNIQYQSRRYKCPTCGKYQSEINPFGDKHKNISRLTKHAILQDLKTPQRTFNDIAKQYHLSSQSVIRLFDQAVEAPRLKLGKTICMDEVFISKRRKSPYACVLYDFDSK